MREMGDEGCWKWRWHRLWQLVDDDRPTMGMKMGFMGNQKKKKWGREEEEMEAGRACGNGLFQWVWPQRVCGEEGKNGREKRGRSCMVCGSWSGCAVGRELKEEMMEGKKKSEERRVEKDAGREPKEEMMEGRKKSEERRVKKDDKKNKNKKLGNGYGEQLRLVGEGNG